ncbi:hypothetical protein EYF80_040269 [Liparis tanakae]|uniref:MADF domain-containing protein n=1 Tax=Liparis tanakae TaxID=230148 RepID=A0A4Z2G7M4_9TELE|nr:hypothetical protein EYF80_040269 [Liparis tanakae]
MNAIAELLSEEVRRYEHLYNPSMAGYKDAQMASNSWREISSNVVLAVDLCLKMWRKLRDKYVREKKAILLPFFYRFPGTSPRNDLMLKPTGMNHALQKAVILR